MPRAARSLIVLSAVLSVALPAAVGQPGFGKPKRKTADEAPADRPAAAAHAETPVADWQRDDPDRLDPTPKAPPGVWHAAKTADGLRYAWSLPADFKPGRSYDVVVLLHPDSANFRWGPANHPRTTEGGFAPGSVLVSVDAMGAQLRSPDARFFEATPENAVRFRDTVLETTRQLPTRHIYLYGQGTGGSFALYFASAFPSLADGVVAHGSAMADGAALKSSVPILLLHGAKDPSTPLLRSVEILDEFTAAGHKRIRLRVLRGLNDFPNPVRAQEGLDYVHALRTDRPDEALAAVRRLLTPKGPDEFGYRAPVWYAGAAFALARFHPDTPDFDKGLTPELRRDARALMDRIDAEGARHVAACRELLKGQADPQALTLDGGPWLGYLAALRDDFRGVPSVEAFAAELKLDTQIAAQRPSAEELVGGWGRTGADTLRFEQAVTLVPKCFLIEWLPVDLGTRTKACLRKADELEIPQDLRDRHEFVTLYDKGWRGGLNAYARDWRQWKLPNPPAAPDAAPGPPAGAAAKP